MRTEEQSSLSSNTIAEIIWVEFEVPVNDPKSLELRLVNKANENLLGWRLHDEGGVFKEDGRAGRAQISISRDVPADRRTELNKSDTFDK